MSEIGEKVGIEDAIHPRALCIQMVPFVGHQGIGKRERLFFDFVDPIGKMYRTASFEEHDFVKITSAVRNCLELPFQIGLNAE